MSLSRRPSKAATPASLNVYDALGSGIFVGVAGTIFAALQVSGNLAFTFGLLELTMAGVGLLGVLSSLRIGVVPNEFAPLLGRTRTV